VARVTIRRFWLLRSPLPPLLPAPNVVESWSIPRYLTIPAEHGKFCLYFNFNFNLNQNVYFEERKKAGEITKKLLDVFHRNMQFLLWCVVLHVRKFVVTNAQALL
jgi:hypothetical protein